MARVLKVFAMWLLLCGVGAVQAQILTPEDGIWWNPAEPGRGFQIETQNGVMVLGTYAFDVGGNPQWYLSAGTYNPATRTFTGSMDGFRGGQCIGCPFRPGAAAGGAGPVTIRFSTGVTATLTAGGATIPIQRLYYNYALPDGIVFGGWVMSQQTVTLVTADWLVFDRTSPASSGPPYVLGNRDGEPGSLVLGRFEASLSRWVFLLDSSASFWRAYQFDMNKRTMIGRSWLYPKGSTLSGSGVPFAGNRLFERVELGVRPAAAGDKRLAQGERDAAEWMQAPKSGDLPAGVAAAVAGLEAEFAALPVDPR
jgi:hypothetical protein